jgi:hypothetical protein
LLAQKQNHREYFVEMGWRFVDNAYRLKGARGIPKRDGTPQQRLMQMIRDKWAAIWTLFFWIGG